MLIKNVETNGYKNIIPIRKAVSDKIGTTALFLSQDLHGDHRIFHSHKGHRDSIIVEVTTLDSFFKDKELPDVIKMDIQGAEMVALEGMHEIIKRKSRLIIFTEFWPIVMERSGYSPIEFLNELIELGFNLYVINEQNQILEPADATRIMKICGGKKGTNLFCVKGEALSF